MFIIVKSLIRINIFLAQIYCLYLFFIILKTNIQLKIFLAQIYCLFFFVSCCKKYHTNDNTSGANLLPVLSFYYCKKYLFIIVKSIMRMKIFLGQVYYLFPFVYYCKEYHKNKIISGANLLLL